MYRAVIHHYDFQYKYKTIGNKKIYAEGNEILKSLKYEEGENFLKMFYYITIIPGLKLYLNSLMNLNLTVGYLSRVICTVKAESAKNTSCPFLSLAR